MKAMAFPAILILLLYTVTDPGCRKQNQKALFDAVLSGNTSEVARLLDKGVDVNARDALKRTPLHGAVLSNNLCSLNLSSTASRNRVDLVKLLLAHGADVNARDGSEYTPLHCAIAWGWRDTPAYEKIVRLLLENGADPSAKDRYDRTPLELAEGSQPIVELLLKYGAKK